jgi:sulfonate transport system substrate-binding protein
VLEAIDSGHLDAGMLGDASLTYAVAAGVKAKAIFVTNYFGNAVITAKDSSFASMHDLKGKKIGTVKGSAGHASALLALKKAGMKADDVTFVFTTPSEATLALNSGAVDAVTLWDPYISLGLSDFLCAGR